MVDEILELDHALFELFKSVVTRLDRLLKLLVAFREPVVAVLDLPLQFGVEDFLLFFEGSLELLEAFRDRFIQLVDLRNQVLHRRLLDVQCLQVVHRVDRLGGRASEAHALAPATGRTHLCNLLQYLRLDLVDSLPRQRVFLDVGGQNFLLDQVIVLQVLVRFLVLGQALLELSLGLVRQLLHLCDQLVDVRAEAVPLLLEHADSPLLKRDVSLVVVYGGG